MLDTLLRLSRMFLVRIGLALPYRTVAIEKSRRRLGCLLEGTKNSILLKGRWFFYKGEVVIISCPELSFSVWATVEEARRVALKKVTHRECWEADFSNYETMLKILNSSPEDKVTVLRCINLDGFLKDNPDWLDVINEASW